MIKQVKKEDWMNTKWRPAMGWMYMLTCVADFILFPVLWSILQSITHGNVTSQWQPLTLQGAGLFHLAMGAVLGIAAFGRTQEKIAVAPTNNSITRVTTPDMPTITNYRPDNHTLSVPEIRMINGKPAPQPAYQPEI